MKVIVKRDSVCMGDDCFDHTKEYEFDNEATYEDLFHSLIQDDYFPGVHGNNVVWVLTTKDCECIFSYFTLMNKFSQGLTVKKLSEICKTDNHVFLKYYTNPQKWKDKIYSMYNGDEYTMWRDGWIDEIKYCNYLIALG